MRLKFIAFRPLQEFRHHERGVAHAGREAPFIVIPGQDRDEIAVHDLGLVEVEDRRAVVMDEIARDVGLVGEAEHALHRAVTCSGDDRGIDRFRCRLLFRDEFQVDDRDVRRRDADRDAVELAFEFRQDKADSLGGAGRGRDHRERSSAGPVEVLVHLVERWLVIGVGMDRGHHALLYADQVVEDLGDRRQAVRGARRVRDDHVVLGDRVVVHAENDGLVGIGGGRRDQDALGAGGEVGRGLFLVGEDAGAFHGDIDIEFAVRQVFRIADGGAEDRLAIDHDLVTVDLNVSREAAMNGVEAQEMGIRGDGAEIIDRDDFNVLAVMLDDGAQDETSDPAKSIDCDTYCHFKILLRRDKNCDFAGPLRCCAPPVHPDRLRYRATKRDLGGRDRAGPVPIGAACKFHAIAEWT